MLPLNPLYEVVPVTKETMPPPGRHHVITNDGQKALYHFTGNDISIITMREQYTHYLRPLPPERMEEWVREIVGKAWDASAESERAGTIINVTQKQTFTDNLLNEMRNAK